MNEMENGVFSEWSAVGRIVKQKKKRNGTEENCNYNEIDILRRNRR